MIGEVGRNGACPCGSGAKYKKCCLPKDDAQRKPRSNEDAVIVCMPTRGSISHETLSSLELNTNGLVKAVIRVARKPIVEARNHLAKTALDFLANPQWPFVPRNVFVLWLDDDAWLPPGVLSTMVEAMRDPRLAALDALFGWFCTRAPYSAPVAFCRFDDPQSRPQIGINSKQGDIVPIAAAGFHCVLMRPHLLEQIGPDPFSLNPAYREGEDWAFCRRANAIGAKLGVGTALPVAHVDPRDGLAYMVGSPPLVVVGNELRIIDAVHRGADGEAKTVEIRKYGLDELEAAQAADDTERLLWIEKEVQQRRAVGGNTTRKAGTRAPRRTRA